MTSFILSRTTALLWLTVLLLCASVASAQNSLPPAPAAPLAGATVSDWKGEVQLQVAGQSLGSPRRGQVLSSGTILNTNDGRLLLQLSDGSQVVVRPHTRLQLRQPSVNDWSYFQLLLGRILAKITKRTGGAPPFQLGTPSALISVRGTSFDVEVNRHAVTEVDVFEGLVEVSSIGGQGPSVLVEPGFSTRIGMGTAPEPPRPTEELRPDVERSDRERDVEQRLQRELEPASKEGPESPAEKPGVESPNPEPPQ